MDMDLGDAIRTINWEAKNLSAARYVLSAVRKNKEGDGWITDIPVADARCIDQITQEHGTDLHLVANICKYKKGCDLDVTEESCPLHEMKYNNLPIHKVWFRKIFCNECEHFKQGVHYTYQEPKTKNIETAIMAITQKIDFLYALKKEALEISGAPVSYQTDSAGRIFRLYDIDGYKPHCPADASEASQIINGKVPVLKTILREKKHLSTYQLEYRVEDAVKFLEDYIERRRKNGNKNGR